MSQAIERKLAMEALVGLRKDRRVFADTCAYVRRLRKGSRLKRLARK